MSKHDLGRRQGVGTKPINAWRSANVKITEELLRTDLNVLSHGGQEAISLFLEMSRRLHEAGQGEALRDWVVVAAPALPERERGELIILLMYGYLYLTYQMAERTDGSIH
jgi:hypothetical protein